MYQFDLLETKDFDVTKIGEKSVYNLDGNKPYLSHIKSKTILGAPIDFPNMYGTFDVRYNTKHKFYDNGLGYLVCEGDTVESNPSAVFLISGPSYRNRGVVVTEGNFDTIVSYFAARLSIKTDWKNQKDSYLFSEVQSRDSIGDCMIYSIFNSSSHQSALKNITFNNFTHRVKNHFFPLSKKYMMGLSDTHGFDEMYNDARLDSDRFLCQRLNSEFLTDSKLEKESLNILEMFQSLVETSFETRIAIADETNHLMCWDSGFSQYKKFWKEFYPKQFEQLRSEYKKLEKKMEKRTYDLGFLFR